MNTIKPIGPDPIDTPADINKPYSLVVDCPHPELDTRPYDKEIHMRIACRDVDQMHAYVPLHIFGFIKKCFGLGSFRVEIVDGENSYKAYRKWTQVAGDNVSDIEYENKPSMEETEKLLQETQADEHDII